jgi:hypothetical protein
MENDIEELDQVDNSPSETTQAGSHNEEEANCCDNSKLKIAFKCVGLILIRIITAVITALARAQFLECFQGASEVAEVIEVMSNGMEGEEEERAKSEETRSSN